MKSTHWRFSIAIAGAVSILLLSFQNCSSRWLTETSSSSPLSETLMESHIKSLDVSQVCTYKEYGSGCPEGWICPSQPLLPPTTQIGAWYSLYFYDQSKSENQNYLVWDQRTRYAPLLSKFGPTKPDGTKDFYGYDAGDVISQQYDCFKRAGINYLILDDTNGVDNDGGRIDQNAQKVFNHLKHDIPISIALGNALWHPSLNGNRPERQRIMDIEADKIFNEYASKPNYKKWENGKPLLVIYNDIEKTYADDDHLEFWDDSRFAVKDSAHQLLGKSAKLQKYKDTGVWGWAVFDPLESSETMTVQPGYYTLHMPDRAGHPFVLKNNGANYMKHWLLVLKNKPRNIVIPSWNDWAEETAIEPAYARVASAEKSLDAYGVEVPDWYLQITEAYANLRIGFMEGNFYKTESKNEVYKVVRGKFEIQSEMPHEKPVIIVPDGSIVVTPTENKKGWKTGSFSACSASPSYAYGAWSTCSNNAQTRTASCINTSGTQSRSVACVNEVGQVVADSECTGAKPITTQSCTASCSGSAITTQSCSTGSPTSLNGVYKMNDQVLFADATNYCMFSSLASYYDITGATNTNGLPSISSKPTQLTQKSDCFKIPAGIFKIGYNLYYSNGGNYCYFPNMELYTARTGRTEANGVATYSELPIVMKNDGNCK